MDDYLGYFKDKYRAAEVEIEELKSQLSVCRDDILNQDATIAELNSKIALELERLEKYEELWARTYEGQDPKLWRVIVAARYIEGVLQEEFDCSYMSGGHPMMVEVREYNRLLVYLDAAAKDNPALHKMIHTKPPWDESAPVDCAHEWRVTRGEENECCKKCPEVRAVDHGPEFGDGPEFEGYEQRISSDTAVDKITLFDESD